MLLEQRPRFRRRQCHELAGKPPADLEMLIVDAAGPVAAPLRKTMMREQLDHRFGHAGALLLPPEIALAGGRVDRDAARATLDIGILDGIEIDRHAVGMQRHRIGALDAADIECRRVVRRHRGVVVTAIVIHQLRAGDRKLPAAQCDEDRQHMIRHRVERHQLAVVMGGAVESPVAEPHQPQAIAADWASRVQDFGRPHVAAERFRNRQDRVGCRRWRGGLRGQRRAAERAQKQESEANTTREIALARCHANPKPPWLSPSAAPRRCSRPSIAG